MRLLILADVSGRAAHVGDEAMLEANIHLLRRVLPDCSIEVATGPGWDGSRLGVHTVPRLDFSPLDGADRESLLDALTASPDVENPAVRAALACDALIISGGGNLSKSWPHHIDERIAMARIAASRGAQVILLGQTLGPEFRPREHALVSELLRLSAWTGVRETYSYALALELGADRENLSYQLDDAAFLQPERPPTDVLEKLALPESRPWIAVTAHPIGAPTVQNPVVTQLAASLRAIARETAAELVFLPHVAFPAEDRAPGDLAFGEAIQRALYNNPAIRLMPVLSAAQTLWLTQQAALVISTRYHPLVFALAGGVPAIGLWSDEYTRRKLQGALIHAGRSEDAMPLADALDGGLVTKATELWRSRSYVNAELQTRAEKWRVAEAERAEKLKQRLLRNVPPQR